MIPNSAEEGRAFVKLPSLKVTAINTHSGIHSFKTDHSFMGVLGSGGKMLFTYI